MIIIVCVLIVVGIIGHTYYNVLVPIRQLQVAAIHISEGDLEYELPSIGGSEFDGLYKDFDTMQTKLRETTEERNRADALTKEVIGNISHDLKTPLTAIKGYAEGIMDGVAATPERWSGMSKRFIQRRWIWQVLLMNFRISQKFIKKWKISALLR